MGAVDGGDVVALEQQLEGGLELAPLVGAERLDEALEPGEAGGHQLVGIAWPVGGQRDAADAAVLGVLDAGREVALDEAVDGAAGGGERDAEARRRGR